VVVDPSAQEVEDHHPEQGRHDGSRCLAPTFRTSAVSADFGQLETSIQ
jgi:hypothetical protein